MKVNFSLHTSPKAIDGVRPDLTYPGFLNLVVKSLECGKAAESYYTIVYVLFLEDLKLIEKDCNEMGALKPIEDLLDRLDSISEIIEVEVLVVGDIVEFYGILNFESVANESANR